jgi:hypothetical protein
MKTILNHELIKILEDKGQYRVLISMTNGGQVEHQPFPGDQRGLVAAVSLAVDVLAGKIWLSHVAETDSKVSIPERVLLERKIK